MRETSPLTNVSVNEYLNSLPAEERQLVNEIRKQKIAGQRPRPSISLIDRSLLFEPAHRARLLDAVAALVDENYAGRSEMCLQFAVLLQRALVHLGLPARGVVGTAIYYDAQRNEIFRWGHGWVRIRDEVIDGNTDILFENPLVPSTVKVAPYWGPVAEIPSDRRLRAQVGASLPLNDPDVLQLWWPDLRIWLDREFSCFSPR